MKMSRKKAIFLASFYVLWMDVNGGKKCLIENGHRSRQVHKNEQNLTGLNRISKLFKIALDKQDIYLGRSSHWLPFYKSQENMNMKLLSTNGEIWRMILGESVEGNFQKKKKTRK